MVYPIAPNTRDIAPEVLDKNRLRILPAAYWATTTPDERASFGTRHGIYSFPTIELVEYLQALINNRVTIEIGAGNGILAEALGIPGTDSKQQEKQPYRLAYELSRQEIVPYGPNVIECDAYNAVRRYRPEVVLACWVTHKYHPNRHAAGGNEAGVNEDDILNRCRQYIFVGNEQVHAGKAIWRRPHAIEYPPFLYSRARNPSRNFIAIFQGTGPSRPA